MNEDIKALLMCLIDEISFSQSPSELTLAVLEKYKDEYDFVNNYLEEYESKFWD
ncbi:MAG TPA: hypothetical protein VF941_08610 [Clostridia bacterium]